MKVSEAIEELKYILERYGDMDVVNIDFVDILSIYPINDEDNNQVCIIDTD